MGKTIFREIHINDYDYDLPDARIAKYPLKKRDESKLLVYRNREITDAKFSDLPEYLPADSLLIFNNTKVIQARLHFKKQTGAQIEIFCLEPHIPHDYQLSFQQIRRCSWICLVGNLKKWKEGELVKDIEIEGQPIQIRARRLQTINDAHIIEFEWNNPQYTFSDILEVAGELPIPPYLNRDTEEQDKLTYQTVYSKIEGSVAAPTAGLHFTEDVFDSLQEKGIKTAEITLHVGAGTFKPVKSDTLEGHEMHAELIAVRRSIIEQLLAHKGNIIAVGTTSVRTLESLYYIGRMIKDKGLDTVLEVEQWSPYHYYAEKDPLTVMEALEAILSYLDNHRLNTLVASTRILIEPGYIYQIVDGIITNFHQPKSTLLLLVSAFTGYNDPTNPKFDYWKEIYSHALNNSYRFLSYGDSSLLLKDKE